MDAGTILGRGIAFPPRIGADGRWAWSEGEPNIREAIQVVVLTEPGNGCSCRISAAVSARCCSSRTPRRPGTSWASGSAARSPTGSPG